MIALLRIFDTYLFSTVGNSLLQRQAGSIEKLTVSRRPYGAADLILRLTQDCVRWREPVLG